MAFARFALIVLVAQTIIYASLFFYFRAAERERLEAGYAPGTPEPERDAFVERALLSYMRRLRVRLATVVYGLPILILAGYIYWSNLR